MRIKSHGLSSSYWYLIAPLLIVFFGWIFFVLSAYISQRNESEVKCVLDEQHLALSALTKLPPKDENKVLKHFLLAELKSKIEKTNYQLKDYQLDAPLEYVLAEEVLYAERELPQLENENKTLYATVLNHLNKLNLKSRLVVDRMVASHYSSLTFYCFLLLAAFLAVVVLGFHYFRSQVLEPVHQIAAVCNALAMGDVSVRINPHKGNVEMASITEALNKAIVNQSRLYDFSISIGEGNYTTEYSMVSDKDQLGYALTHMRDKLAKVSAEDAARNWTSEGLAKFSSILRLNNENLSELANEFISNLIKYLKANQGAIFILTTESEQATELEMVANYAWDRKKFVQRKLKIGEGLCGQAALEKGTIYMSEVPEDYVHITSGIGSALPKSILIVPLISNDELQGVMEIASFREMASYEIAFVEKIAENFAATLASTRTNEHTRKLLEESRRMTENLRSQEEILRQNTEELHAIQESLNDKLKAAKEEMQLQIRQIEGEKKKNIAILEGCVDGVITFDKKGRVEFVNKAAEEIWGFTRDEILGNNIREFIPINIEENKNDFTACYLNGHRKEIDVRTEITTHNAHGEELSVLLTLTKARIGEELTFTIFTQRISVELF